MKTCLRIKTFFCASHTLTVVSDAGKTKADEVCCESSLQGGGMWDSPVFFIPAVVRGLSLPCCFLDLKGTLLVAVAVSLGFLPTNHNKLCEINDFLRHLLNKQLAHH